MLSKSTSKNVSEDASLYIQQKGFIDCNRTGDFFLQLLDTFFYIVQICIFVLRIRLRFSILFMG